MRKTLFSMMMILLLLALAGSSSFVFAAEESTEETQESTTLATGKISSLTPSYNAMTVKWSKVDGASKYVVYRSTKKSSGFKKVATVKKDASRSFKDTGLTTGKTYYYKVRACAGSTYTETAVKGKKAAPKKAVVSKVKSTASTTLKVTWKKVGGANGYRIYRSTKKNGTYKQIATIKKKSILSYKDTGRTTNKTYYYKVRAYRTVKGKKVWGASSDAVGATTPKNRWDKLLDKYADSKTVNQLIFVKYQGGSKAKVYLYNKSGKKWKQVLSCTGYVGKNGIDKTKEGDKKTPTGTYTITGAFGKKSKPTTSLNYTKVNKYLYLCADKSHYNELIDIRDYPNHKCTGEHLSEYGSVYNYGLFLDFNSEGVYKKGSAIFMHCTGSYKYTAGCIAVSQSNMLKILKTLEDGAKICIYKA